MARRSLLALTLAVGCGPSVTAVYEGNVRFEHCYRLDLDPNIAASHREACWRDWAQRYTYGQTRDRLEYARRRIAALSSGDRSQPALDLTSSPDGGTTSPVEAPVPTSGYASPPPMLSTASAAADAGAPLDAGAVSPGPSDAGAALPIKTPPGAACILDCRGAWTDCSSRCDDGGPKRACRCEKDYRRCVQRCLK